MSWLYYHLYFLLLLADECIYASSAIQPPEFISAKIQSYEYNLSTNKPQISSKESDYVSNLTTSKPANKIDAVVPRDLSFELTAADSNNIKRAVEPNIYTEEIEDDPEGPPDHVIPHSEHENPKEPPTRPNYTAPGDWAKPPKEKNIPLDFVPSKLYAQVRGTHTIKHLPKEASTNSGESEEDKENAARLKEVVKVSKANTIYTEEGYEDAAYDHAGQIRDADFQEDFAKKLDNKKEKQRSHGGKRRRPKSFKRVIHRKNKSKAPHNLIDDYRDHVEEASGEARVLKKRIKPESLKYLRVALNQPIINPKVVVEDGVTQLERDLRKESYEIQRTSTEPYTPTTSVYIPPVSEEITENNVDFETTTIRRDIYTVRPKKFSKTVKPSTFTKVKKSKSYYPGSIKNGNYNYYTTNSKLSESTTVGYVQDFRQDYDNKRNQTFSIFPTPYQKVYPESENFNKSFISNPLTIATFNGHGPYLVVVTSPSPTSVYNSLENQNLKEKNYYRINRVEHVTSPSLINSYHERNPFFLSEAQNIKITKNQDLALAHTLQKQKKNLFIQKLAERNNEQDIEHKNPEQSKHDKMLKYLINEKRHLTIMHTPKVSEALVMYPNYLRSPYSSVPKQWPVAHESEKPVESVYNVMFEAERPSVEATVQKNLLPVTRLLPPAPLSRSEYSSFYIPSKRIYPASRSVISMVPIIEAINKKENKKSFPFIFRKKRSTITPTREWEILQRDKRLRNTELRKITETSTKQRNKKQSSNLKYPAHFRQLLNESPVIAADVVNREIQERFKDKSGKSSNETLNESSYEITDKYNDDREKSVEAEVPELDFSNIFEEDEVEVTTEKLDFDVEKYPFYNNRKVEENSALKYIVNPLEVPKKSLGGMEFYNSRNLECEEVDPSLEKIVPEEEELANKHGPRKGKPKLYGLGDKVDCYKAKYLDENPLDNPLFLERQIEIPSPPSELNPKIFASRLLELPPNNEDYAVQRGPKFPEEYTSRKSRIKYKKLPKKKFSESRLNYDYFVRPKKSSLISTQYQKNRNLLGLTSIDDNRKKQNKTRNKQSIKKSKLKITPSYQRHVYDDVMGTIKNIEGTYKVPGLKKEQKPMHSKLRLREYYREQEYDATDISKNGRPASINGLVAPPRRAFNNFLRYKSRKRYHSHQIPHVHVSRIFKRSVNTADDMKKVNNRLNENENNNNNNNNNNSTNKSNTFRIIFTTPIPEKSKRKRKNVAIVSNEPIIKEVNYTNSAQMKHPNRSEADPGKYGKFINNDNLTVSIDIRRNEPRYNISEKRISIINLNNTSNSAQSESPTITSKPSVSDSTLIPVIVKPDASFTGRLPQESKATYTKYQFDKTNTTKNPEDINNDKDKIDKAGEVDSINIKNQYSVHENIQEDNNDKNEDDLVTDFTPRASTEEHKELYDFLKGDPPGYREAFYKEKHPVSNENRLKESLKNEETKISITEKVDPADEEESTKESNTEGISLNDAEEQPVQDEHSNNSEEEDISTTPSQLDDEPFVRYSDRPYSPSENYEDDLYSDIGPRVNKPYFYHPPFDVPEYEKSTFGTTIKLSKDDDWSRTKETDHEKYVFPWEKDEEDEKVDQSQNYSTLDSYEFPWEKRERKERERKRREKLEKKYGKSYFDNIESDEEDENSKEASNTKLTYASFEKPHSRGKKDVSNVAVNTESDPPIKFSSKYKSGVTKRPHEKDEMLITDANSDEIKQSIINYMEKSKTTTPRIPEIVYKIVANNLMSADIASHLPNKSNRRREHTIKPESLSIQSPNNISTLNSSGYNETTATTSSILNSTPKYHQRIRTRKIKLKSSNTQINDTKELPDQIKQNQNSSILVSPIPKNVRRPNRIRKITGDNSKALSNIPTTISPIKLNNRRRNRQTTTTDTPNIISTTSKSINKRRRGPFRIKFNNESVVQSPKIDQDRITRLSSSSPSTGKTIEHHSRVSKEEIITKTIYPDESDDDEDGKDDIHRKSSKIDSIKISSENKPIKLSKLKRRTAPKNVSQDEHTRKKEKVERVTITMEETPDHVYKTKEVDKDGVKGKFVTITANNNMSPKKGNGSLETKDPEMEEIKRKMDAFNSFDSVIQDSDKLSNEAITNREAETSNYLQSPNKFQNYLLGNLLQKLPVPATQRLKPGSRKGNSLSDRQINEDYDDNDDYNDDDDEDDDDDDDDSDGEYENNDDEDSDENGGDDNYDNNDDDDSSNSNIKKSVKEEKIKPANSTNEKPSFGFIKDPSKRQYFYVENR